METQTLWSRVGRWFKKPDTVGLPVDSATHPTTLDSLGSPLERTVPDRSPDSTALTPVTNPEKSRVPGLFRRSRSNRQGRLVDRNSERLEAQYAHVESLMDAIERHMESQADRSERIACSLDSLAQSLTGVPEAFRHQLEVLANIRETVTAEQDRAGRIEESLAQWPRVADAQRETMVSISRQLDEAREANAGTSSAIEECRHAFAKVEETTSASTKALERYTGETRTGTQRMAALLEEQADLQAGLASRFQLFAWAAIGLAGVAAVIAVISLLR